MEAVKKTKDYTIYQKRSKRYAIRRSDHRWINGDEKVTILVGEKLLKVAAPKPKKEAEKDAEAAETPE
jgi:hypothetical protein